MMRGRMSNLSSLMNSSPGYEISITASELSFRGRNMYPAEQEERTRLTVGPIVVYRNRKESTLFV
jgi:hypothetical protein